MFVFEMWLSAGVTPSVAGALSVRSSSETVLWSLEWATESKLQRRNQIAIDRLFMPLTRGRLEKLERGERIF